VIRRAVVLGQRGQAVVGRDKSNLIAAYHYLFGERLPDLFDRCHTVLWNLFESAGETENLFSLFRHSSLIWRLRGESAKETEYLRKLARYAQSVILQDVRKLSREVAYYLVRADSVGD